MGIRHPWELTLGEFAERVRRDYGIEIREILKANILFFKSEGRLYVLPRLDSDEILKPDTIRVLCQIFNLPAVDFSLDAEEDD